MSGGVSRRWGFSSLLAGTLCATALAGATSARADTFEIRVDQAKIMHLPPRVATIVVGNPLIADAALQAGGVLVITGKGYGSTNMLALDQTGRIVMDQTVQVTTPAGANLVTVYRGVGRESYSCAPQCVPRITLGDAPNFFGPTMAQSVDRVGAGQAAGGKH
jgi:Flp pilus assembly secretin CpaC